MSPYKQELAYQRRILLLTVTSLAIIILIMGFFVSRADELAAAAPAQPTPTQTAPTPLPGERVQLAPVLVTPAKDELVGAGTVNLAGIGPAGYEIRATIDNRNVGSTMVGPDNSWTIPVELPLPGDYKLVLATMSLDGEVVAITETIGVNVTDFE